jgi:DNA-binding transcriptional regulator LsrR (DeoR family)
MRHQDDMTLEEIAKETGMTRRSASTIISSAKKHLLKLIKDT